MNAVKKEHVYDDATARWYVKGQQPQVDLEDEGHDLLNTVVGRLS